MILSNRLDLIQKSLSDLAATHNLFVPAPDSQFMRRSCYHNVFASVETILWLHRQICCDRLLPDSESKFWAGELALLRGESYEFDGINGARIVPHHMSIIDSTRFTFRMVGKLVEKDLEAAFNQPDWLNFRNAVSTKSRLSHPRNQELLNVSEQDLKDLDDGLKWFTRQVGVIHQILKRMGRNPQTRVKNMN
ncbi:hypothetical protein [Dyadobacter jiangsuensis]|nr:hypothetical protein [Dyadobacter jiangsuensis]